MRVWIGAVVQQEEVGDAGQPLERVLVANAIGSSETLPLVITSGTPTSASSRWCSGE